MSVKNKGSWCEKHNQYARTKFDCPHCELDELRARVARLEEALRKVRDYDCYKHPDDDIIAIREAALKESENCTACQHAKKAKWPPSGLCNEHYRTVTRAQERVSQMFSYKQTWGPREIARRALEEK